MSFEDGPVPEAGDDAPAYDEPSTARSLLAPVAAVVRRLRVHVREWPRRYVEMQVEVIRESE